MVKVWLKIFKRNVSSGMKTAWGVINVIYKRTFKFKNVLLLKKLTLLGF